MLTFGHAKENETRFLAVEKSLLKTENNASLKVQETMEFKMTKPKEDRIFDQHINVPEKGLMGVANLEH